MKYQVAYLEETDDREYRDKCYVLHFLPRDYLEKQKMLEIMSKSRSEGHYAIAGMVYFNTAAERTLYMMKWIK